MFAENISLSVWPRLNRGSARANSIALSSRFVICIESFETVAMPITASCFESCASTSATEKLNRFFRRSIRLFTILRLSFSDAIPWRWICIVNVPTSIFLP